MKLLKELWINEDGFVASADMVMITVFLVIGMIVGLATYRDQVVQEFGDMAAAIGQLNQSYSIANYANSMFSVAGSMFSDMADFCEQGVEEGSVNNNDAGSPPACLGLSDAVPE